jgi:HPt (histidine-containing phosphotransfer) domain-containing protein
MTTQTIRCDSLAVYIRRDLQELIPFFLEMRRKDIQKLLAALATGDFGVLRISGHNMAGTGAAYGFQLITDIGRAMETAALAGDALSLKACISQLEYFVDHVEVIYV